MDRGWPAPVWSPASGPSTGNAGFPRARLELRHSPGARVPMLSPCPPLVALVVRLVLHLPLPFLSWGTKVVRGQGRPHRSDAVPLPSGQRATGQGPRREHNGPPNFRSSPWHPSTWAHRLARLRASQRGSRPPQASPSGHRGRFVLDAHSRTQPAVQIRRWGMHEDAPGAGGTGAWGPRAQGPGLSIPSFSHLSLSLGAHLPLAARQLSV